MTGAWRPGAARTGQVFALFVIVLAAAEIGVGLAIVLQFYRLRASVAVDDVPDRSRPDGYEERVVNRARASGTVPSRPLLPARARCRRTCSGCCCRSVPRRGPAGLLLAPPRGAGHRLAAVGRPCGVVAALLARRWSPLIAAGAGRRASVTLRFGDLG